MRIGTITTGSGVVSVFNLNYLPQRLAYAASTQLTSLKVEVLGEGVICDLNASGLTCVGRIGVRSVPTNGYVVDLADGKILDKNVVITVVNSASQTPGLYAFGDSIGTGYIKSLMAKVFANTNAEFARFAALGIPQLGVNDKITVTYEDGLTEILERDDLQYIIGEDYIQNDYVLLNIRANIEKAQILCANDTTVYVVKYGL